MAVLVMDTKLENNKGKIDLEKVIMFEMYWIQHTCCGYQWLPICIQGYTYTICTHTHPWQTEKKHACQDIFRSLKCTGTTRNHRVDKIARESKDRKRLKIPCKGQWKERTKMTEEKSESEEDNQERGITKPKKNQVNWISRREVNNCIKCIHDQRWRRIRNKKKILSFRQLLTQW